MFSVLPKESVQSVRGVWFVDVAWSAAFGAALSDAGTSRREKYERTIFERMEKFKTMQSTCLDVMENTPQTKNKVNM